MTTIKLKNGSGAPTAGDLVQGEPALDLTNKRLYTEDSGGTVIEVGTNPGASGAVTLNYSGSAKLATTSTGIDVTGNIAVSSAGARRIDISNTSLADTGEMVSLQWDANADLTFQGRASDGTFKANWYRIEADASDGLADAHRFYTDSSVERMNITSAGINVTGTVTADGITSSADILVQESIPQLILDDTDVTDASGTLVQAGSTLFLRSRGGTSSYGAIRFARNNGSDTNALDIASNGDISFYNDAGTSQGLFWDASLSRLGLGTTSPSTDLHIASSNPVIRLEDTDGAGAGTSQIQNTASGNLRLMADSNNTATSSTIEFEVDGTEHMRIDASGQVGIGAAPSGVKLDVADTTDTSIRVRSTGTGASDDTVIRNLIGGTTANNYIYFGDSDDANAGQIRYVHSDDSMRIYAGATTERLRLYSTASIFYNGATEIGRFASNNYFGIGLNNPTAPLTVNGNSNGLLAEFGGNNTVPTRRLQLNEYAVSGINNSGFEFNAPGAGSAAAISFSTLGTEIMRIGGAGSSTRVGIGTTSPSSKLHVKDTSSIVRSEGTGGYGSFYAIGSGTFSSHLFMGNGGGEKGRITTNDSGAILFSNTTSATERMRIDASGNLFIGKTSASFGTEGIAFNTPNEMTITRDSGTCVFLRRNTADGEVQTFYKDTSKVGSISVTSSATAYNTSSDRRLKDNIVDAPSASDDIDAIQVRSFDWKADGSHQKYGMVAQELNTVAPDAVTEGDTDEDMMAVDYSKLVPMLVKEIQSLRARVAQLEGAN